MFAVPGWAVSADGLKSETNKALAPAPAAAAAAGQQNEPSNDNKSKKRKRPSMPSNVTSENMADLWERVIEGKSGKKPKTDKGFGSKDSKEKKQNGHVKEQQSVAQDKEVEKSDGAPQNAKKKSKKDKKKDKQASESQGDEGEAQKEAKSHTKKEQGTVATAPAAPAAAPPAPKLTPMQAAMREKLISARFRYLNETLYTRPSAEAFQLFEESPEMFREYHEGFRRQVDVWPENPVDGYIAEIQLRGRQRTPAPSKHRQHHHQQPQKNNNDDDDDNSNSNSNSGVSPLPRTGGTCTIADLGCGDAKLGAALAASRGLKKLRLEVHSYDLHSTSPHVTRADIADLPRADGSVDVAVFCLALMGTNWLDFVEEAYRVLRWKGELWVAEIKSRFSGSGSGSGSAGTKKNAGGGGNNNNNNNNNGVVSHSVGNRRKAGAVAAAGKKGGKKNGDDEGGADHEMDLAVEVDGAEDRRGETDVSGFVEALRRRGFVLQGEPDLRNRMFVRMRFMKAAPATVGKCAVPVAAAAAAAAVTTRDRRDRHPMSLAQKRNSLKKFLDAGTEEDQVKADEKGILKPCVYKIR